jgi:hypothetical protein
MFGGRPVKGFKSAQHEAQILGCGAADPLPPLCILDWLVPCLTSLSVLLNADKLDQLDDDAFAQKMAKIPLTFPPPDVKALVQHRQKFTQLLQLYNGEGFRSGLDGFSFDGECFSGRMDGGV